MVGEQQQRTGCDRFELADRRDVARLVNVFYDRVRAARHSRPASSIVGCPCFMQRSMNSSPAVSQIRPRRAPLESPRSISATLSRRRPRAEDRVMSLARRLVGQLRCSKR
jgi:hypothetical protein